MWKVLKEWYEGEFIPWDKDPNSTLIFIGAGDYRRHFPARALRAGVEFYRKYWQWCIPIAVSLAAILIQFVHTH